MYLYVVYSLYIVYNLYVVDKYIIRTKRFVRIVIEICYRYANIKIALLEFITIKFKLSPIVLLKTLYFYQ